MRHLFIYVVLFVALSGSGMAASVAFQQDGWSDGGTLRVSFAGEDTNGDGALLLDELADFAAMWSTPAGVDTTWRLPNVEPDGFVFSNIGNYVFFVRNPQFSLVSSAFEGEALATVFDAFLFPVSSTDASASAIPEPGTLSLLGAGVAAVVFGRRRRSSEHR